MPPETDLAVAIAKIDSITGDMAEVKQTMRDLAAAVARLAVIEERQTSTNEAIARAFKEISTTNQTVAGLAIRVASLEQSQPIQRQTNALVQGAVKYILAAVLGAIIAGLLRMPPALPAQNQPVVTGK